MPQSKLQTVILTQADIERLANMRLVLRVVEQAFKAQARGEATMPPKLYLNIPDHGDFRAMPAALAHPACCGVKWVNVHPNNPAKGLPTVMGIVLINDAKTGFPLGILDGTSVTRLRTGASAGVAAKTLARLDSKVAALIGCGAMALAQVQALEVSVSLTQIRVWGHRDGEAKAFCESAKRAVRAELVPTVGVREAVRDTDIIVTITSSRKPLVMRDWIKPGTHINAIGADAPGKQELDPAILKHAKVIVDDETQAVHGGEINVPIAKGQFKAEAIHATLGEVLVRKATGRTRAGEITVFDSTGLATHDVAVGYELLQRARQRRIGRAIALFHTKAAL